MQNFLRRFSRFFMVFVGIVAIFNVYFCMPIMASCEDTPLNVYKEHTLNWRTEARTKDNASSVYLNLEGWHGVAEVKVIGIGGRRGAKLFENCNIGQKNYEVRGGYKYELWQNVNEHGWRQCYLVFKVIDGGTPNSKWSPNYAPEAECIVRK